MAFIWIHKLALVFSILIGIILFFKKSDTFIKFHRWIGLITVLGMVGYMISSRFESIGYMIYTMLFLLLFVLPLKLKNRTGKLSHIGVMVLAITWLIYIH